ncbi:Glycoside hydrolase family 85 protein [Mycena sanguinolenta]|uniref:Glycoside hydrolase family 85 protein n=1 Tax=Mycena sanguinolenta TaxID=230812 RepID=A0A8H7D0Y1_9AGAR|nr:Glycoside hydrolase family 85 protein [Mycena sanguinolenta]
MPLTGSSFKASDAQYFKSLEELDVWTATPTKALDTVLKYHPRRPSSNPKGKLFGDPHALVAHAILNTVLLKVCHDYKGGYTESPFSLGYTFNFWSAVDVFIYFSHHRVTVPPPGWITAAHRQGVKMLGTLIFEGNGEDDCLRLPCRASLPLSPHYARLLAELAHERGFDGYLLNFECPLRGGIEQTRAVTAWTTLLVDELKGKIGSHAEVVWYDSVVVTGQLAWQDRLNGFNLPFFLSSTSFFSNYTWPPSYPSKTVEYFRSVSQNTTHIIPKAKQDIYMGIDVFGRGSHGGGGFGSYKALEHITGAGLSTAFFAPGWTWENTQDASGFTWESWFTDERRLWAGLRAGERVTVPNAPPNRPGEPPCTHGAFAPVGSFFCTRGAPPTRTPSRCTRRSALRPGREGWTDVDKQTSIGDLVWPVPVLAWEGDEDDVHAAALPAATSELTLNEAWNGGSSLRLGISAAGEESEDAAFRCVWLPVQSVTITPGRSYNATAVYKIDQEDANVDLDIALSVKMMTSPSVYSNAFDVVPQSVSSDPLPGGWTKLQVQFESSTPLPDATTVKAAIGFVISIVAEDPSKALQLSLLLGQLNVYPTPSPTAPTHAPMLLWADFNASGSPNAPFNGMLTWEVAATFAPLSNVLTLTGAEDPAPAWPVAPSTERWLPRFVYFNIYAQPHSAGAALIQKPAEAAWIGTSGYDGPAHAFSVQQANFPFDLSGVRTISFYVQGVTDRGEVLRWDQLASLYTRAAKHNITLHGEYNTPKCPDTVDCRHCLAFYDHLDSLRLEKPDDHWEADMRPGDIIPIGGSNIDAVFRLAEMRGYLRTREHFLDLNDDENGSVERRDVSANREYLQRTLEELHSQHDAVVAERDRMVQEREQLQQTIAELRRQHDGVVAERERERGQLQQMVVEMHRQHDGIVAEREQIIRGLRDLYDNVTVERDGLQQTVAKLQRQHDGVVAQQDRLQQTIQDSRSLHNSVVMERDELQQTVAELQRQHAGVVAERDRRVQEVRDLYETVIVERNGLQQMVPELQLQHDAVVAERALLQQTVQDSRSLYDGVVMERDELQQTVAELQRRLRCLSDGIVVKREELHQTIAELTCQRDWVAVKREELQHELADLHRQREGDVDSVVKREDLEQTVAELLRPDDNAVAERDRLQRSVPELQLRYDSVVAERDRAVQEQGQLQQAGTDLQHQHDGVVAEREQLQSQHSGSVAELNRLQRTVPELRSLSDSVVVERRQPQQTTGDSQLQPSQHAPKRKGGADSVDPRPPKRLAISNGATMNKQLSEDELRRKFHHMPIPGPLDDPILLANWIHYHQVVDMKGIRITKPDWVIDLRTVRGHQRVMSLVPPRPRVSSTRNDPRQHRERCILAVLRVLTIPGEYQRLVCYHDISIARAVNTHPCTFGGLPDRLTGVTIARLLASRGLSVADADDAWLFCHHFVRDELDGKDPSLTYIKASEMQEIIKLEEEAQRSRPVPLGIKHAEDDQYRRYRPRPAQVEKAGNQTVNHSDDMVHRESIRDTVRLVY